MSLVNFSVSLQRVVTHPLHRISLSTVVVCTTSPSGKIWKYWQWNAFCNSFSVAMELHSLYSTLGQNFTFSENHTFRRCICSLHTALIQPWAFSCIIDILAVLSPSGEVIAPSVFLARVTFLWLITALLPSGKGTEMHRSSRVAFCA